MQQLGYKKVEVFKLSSPLGEPEVNLTSPGYQIERSEVNGKVVWHGINKNWIKDPAAEKWQESGVDGTKECEEPIYEKMRTKLELKLREN